MNTEISEDRPQTAEEEWANGLSHLVGLILGIVAAPLLIGKAVATGDAGRIVGVAVFTATMILLYLVSTLYHAAPHGPVKRILRVADHTVIFLFIAGTYTPFTFGALRGAWGWSIFGVVWALAAVGVALKTLCGVRYPRFSMLLYLLMGWLALVAAYPLWKGLSGDGFCWLLGGGVCYTAGVTYFLNDNHVHFHHFRWHLFVLAGSICHLVAVGVYGI